MISVSLKEIDDIILGFQSEIYDHSQKIILQLEKFRLTLTDLYERKYVRYIISLGEDLIKAHPKKLDEYRDKFDAIIDHRIIKSKSKDQFRDQLIEILGYAELRSKFYPRYFYKIGIKACVYCNAMLTVAVKREMPPGAAKRSIQAKFQADHYLSKNEYPCFSISLYNLYPVCANCNNVKGIKKVLFNLYDDGSNPSNYGFKLVDGTKAKFLLTRNIEDIEIDFNEPLVGKNYQTFDGLFAIKAVYNTQKDIVAELILKKESYTEAYKETLKNSLPKLFHDKSIINRLLMGNYAEEKYIHKRPLAKFTQDIAYQIGLLDKET